MKLTRFSNTHLILMLVTLVLVACGTQSTVGTPSPPAVITEASKTIEVIPTEIEIFTPTPLPGRSLVILVAPPTAQAALVTELTATLSELVSSASLDFEVRQTIGHEDLSDEIRLVIALPPDQGLVDLAAANPRIQFLGISIPGLEPGENLSVISSEMITPDRIGFLAGYLAAVVAPEWRVGTISTSDTTAGVNYRQGFMNGVVFFCGLCRQSYPPFNAYPMYVEIPSGSSSQEWQAMGDILINQAVQTAFIPPVIGDLNIVDYLAAAEINLIGATPPIEGLQERWIATISGDIISPLLTVWPDLIAGKGGFAVAAPLTLSHINPELFSKGRQRLVDNLIGELSDGYIDTGVESPLDQP